MQVPCVAVELAVHRAVRAALGVLVVQVLPLGVLPGGPGVDSVAGVEGVSGRRYARPVGSPLALQTQPDAAMLTLFQVRGAHRWAHSKQDSGRRVIHGRG